MFGIETWVFGILSAVVGLIGYIPYIRDTWSGRTRPERASWLIWSVLGSIAFFSLLYEGAMASLWFAGTQVSATILIFILSIWRGTGKLLTIRYILYLGIAVMGLVIWYYTKSAAYALLITISISLLGGTLTVQKAYDNPRSETLSCWYLAWISSVLALFSVGRLDWVLLSYPLYLLSLYSAIIAAVWVSRSRSKGTGQPDLAPAE